MKKIVISILIMLLFSNNLALQKDFSLLDYFDGSYTSYSNTKINEDSRYLGFCYMNNFEIPKESMIGESMIIYNLEVSSAISTLDAKVIKTEVLSDKTIVIYAYSNKINSSVQVENQDINLQFAIKPEFIIVGWPTIMGSF